VQKKTIKKVDGSESMKTLDEDLFISLVQERPALFDFKLALQYRSKSISKKLWQEIKTILNTSLSVDDLAKKWKALYDYYRKTKGKSR